MEFDFAALSAGQRYKLMAAAITPRPIAWLTTLSLDDRRNAGPYSFFNMMGADPPIVAIGLMRRPDGSLKDSARNILDRGEFVVNLVSESDVEAMNFTCIDAPPCFDELEQGAIVTAPSRRISPPRIASAPVAMECRLFQAIEAGQTTIVLGEVLHFHIRDALIKGDRLHVDTPAMGLVARMHGAGWYARSTDLFQLERPAYADWLADRSSERGIPGAERDNGEIADLPVRGT
jgi:flavin reductase (DIM6/NTAB) family NADH-FMN oxidoreductase RutF